jgi:hypothetical protein
MKVKLIVTDDDAIEVFTKEIEKSIFDGYPF